jgi:hypothetical protein
MKLMDMVGAWHAMPLLLLLAACAGWSHKPAETPAWVTSGVKALPDAGTAALYGLGRAEPNITNVPFSKVTARERARIALAFALENEIRGLLPAPAAQGLIRPVIEAALPHCQIAGNYLAPDKSRFALARLPYSQLVKALKTALADPKLTAAEQAAELQALLDRNLQARGFHER